MVLLAGYATIVTLGAVWIALDAESGYIFDVFGKSFRHIWHDSGERWSYIAMYGWRLLSLGALIVAAIALAWVSYRRHVLPGANSLRLLALITMMAVPFLLIPWVNAAARIRWYRQVRATASRQTNVAETLSVATDLAQELDSAGYLTNVPWTAWHPKKTDTWGTEIFPVAYLHPGHRPSTVFPMDWQCFIAWQLPADFPSPGELLPFRDWGKTTFNGTLIAVAARGPSPHPNLDHRLDARPRKRLGDECH